MDRKQVFGWTEPTVPRVGHYGYAMAFVEDGGIRLTVRQSGAPGGGGETVVLPFDAAEALALGIARALVAEALAAPDAAGVLTHEGTEQVHAADAVEVQADPGATGVTDETAEDGDGDGDGGG